jgi:hypothetical protein
VSLIVGAALASGCARPVRAGLLPARVAIVVEDDTARPMTLLVELRRNARAQLDVRVADGAVAYDGTSLVNLTLSEGRWARDGGPSVPRAPLVLPIGARLAALTPEAAHFDTPDGARTRCPHEDTCAPTDTLPAAFALDAPGPGAGFHVRLQDDDVYVALPQVPEGTRVWGGARAIRGVMWVHAGGASLEPLVNRRFRGHAALEAAPFAEHVVPDGHPSEWDAATPMVIDAPWQLQAGADVHHGARDASFSLAAAWSADRVCLAGRVRDDRVQPGDAVELRVGASAVVLPLDVATQTTAAPGAQDAAVQAATFGRTFEWCTAAMSRTGGEELPLQAVLVDHDGNDPPTRIASAPEEGAVSPRGRLLLSPEAPAGEPRSP